MSNIKPENKEISRIHVVGPAINALKGGQVTHMKNIMSVFSNESRFILSYFFSSTAKEGAESKIVKFFRLIVNWIKFPFTILGKQVIHINSSFDDKALIRDIVLIAWSLLMQKPLVVQYHGGVFGNTNIKKIKPFCSLWVYFLNKASHVLVLTDEQFDALTHLGVKSVEKVTNFVELPSIFEQVNSGFNFIFLGRIVKEKGVFDILDAVEVLNNEFKFNVYFYGDGDDRQKLQNDIEIRGLNNNVKWMGSVDGDEKHQAYKNAHSFLLPTYYPEGMPYSVLESMSYGIPVICSKIGALPQLVSDNDTGILIDAQNLDALVNAMKKVLYDDSYRLGLSKNSREKIEQSYSFEVMRRKFSQLWCH